VERNETWRREEGREGGRESGRKGDAKLTKQELGEERVHIAHESVELPARDDSKQYPENA